MKHLPLLGALLIVLLAPIALRRKDGSTAPSGERALVVITPHNEAIRYEYARGFAKWLASKNAPPARIDYRTPGGTSEITRYLAGEYAAAFESYWTRTLRNPWSSAVERAFSNPKLKPNNTPAAVSYTHLTLPTKRIV